MEEQDLLPTVLIVVAPYYRHIADMQIAGAAEALRKADVAFDLIEVPGALEIPTAISMAHKADLYDGFIALGCVIRGETTHYDTVCNESARGLMTLGIDQHACIGNGILTVENEAQAIARADPEQMNKGGGAAEACLSLIQLEQQYDAFSTQLENMWHDLEEEIDPSNFAPESEDILIAENDNPKKNA